MTEIILIIKPSVELQMALDDLAHGLRELAGAIRTQKASPPEPTGGPVAAKNGGAIEPETPKPAVTAKQPPIAAGSHTGGWCDPDWATPERRASLTKMYQANVRMQMIREQLARLGGPKLPADASIQTFAIQVLGLKRNPDMPGYKNQAAPVPPNTFRIGTGTSVEKRHVP